MLLCGKCTEDHINVWCDVCGFGDTACGGEDESIGYDADSDFEFEDGIISNYNGSGGEVVIPSEINGIEVTQIGSYAFSWRESLSSVTIPASVSSIGDSAFYDCNSLSSVTIPASVTSIGAYAFYDCSSLKTVNLPCNRTLSKGSELFDETGLFDSNPDLKYENHSWETGWSKDASGHWYECTVCGEKKDPAAHTPGAVATEDTPQICTVCEYEITPAFGHTHSYGDWTSAGDGTHTRICLGNSEHKETVNCSGGNNPPITITPAPIQAPTTQTYIVQKGDDLWKIARMFGCTVNDIVVSNSGLIKNPNLIYRGWVLTVPVGGLQQEAPSTGNSDVYVVQSGDALSSIAKRHGCKWRDIVSLNGDLITDPDFILSGWQLKLPQ